MNEQYEQTRSSFESCMYLKMTYFLYHSFKLFSEKNYKEQAQSFNHSLALLTVEIFFNLILGNSWTWTWKICFTWLGLTLLSPHVYPFTQWSDLTWPRRGSKVQLALSVGKIYGI